MTFVYVVMAIVVISFLVWVHELGHYAAARLTGVPVIQFSIGFGPPIPFLSFTSKKTGILYAIRAIPLGGYVAFADTGDEHGIEKYYAQPVWKRFVTTVSGPLMNFVVAFIIAVLYGMLIGIPQNLPNVGTISEGSPAAQAGLQIGDRILRVSGVDIGNDTDLITKTIGEANGKAIDILVDRNGTQVPLVLAPKYDDQSQRYMIGITLAQVPYYMSLGEAVKFSAVAMVDMVKQLLQFLGGLVTQGKGGDQVASPIGIVQVMTQTAQQYGIKIFVDIAVFLSVNLGLFNLLPFPALDGSKVIFQAIEVVRGKPVPPEKEGIVTLVGFVLLIILFIFLMGRDIGRIFGWWPA